MEVSGETHFGEGSRLNKFTRARLLGPRRYLVHAFLIFLALYAVFGWIVCHDIAARSPEQAGYTAFLLIGAGVIAAGFFRSYFRRVYFSAWFRRGIGKINQVAYRIEERGLACETQSFATCLYWSHINEISRHNLYWVFFTNGPIYFLPSRFFGDPESEREFIATCRARLSESARARCIG